MKFDLLRAIPGRLTIAEASRLPDSRPSRRGFRHDGEASSLARWLAVSLLPLAALALSTGAEANTLTVQANIAAACTTTGGALNFGTYNAQSAKTADTTFSVNCSPGANVNIRLGPGQNANTTLRGLKNGGTDILRYNLFKASGGQVWGDGTFGTPVTITNFDSSNHSQHQVFGEVPSGQTTVPPGTYNDSVAISFTFNP